MRDARSCSSANCTDGLKLFNSVIAVKIFASERAAEFTIRRHFNIQIIAKLIKKLEFLKNSISIASV